ncbi:MAG TPA: S8 family peptidase [Vicinamibacterales bacterium]|jgi:serine protease AprX
MIRRVGVLTCVLLTIAVGSARASERPAVSKHAADAKLDAALLARAHSPRAYDVPLRKSRVIVRTANGSPASDLIDAVSGRAGRYFSWLGGQVAIVPDASLEWLASQPEVAALSLDRAVRGTIDRTARTIGARWITDALGFDGAGVGVATIDSGVTGFHEELDGRVVQFVDFVGGQPLAYDDYGHGTHVAGIIAGNGRSTNGERRGIAPGAHLVVLKALDAAGNGYTSTVIAAIDYAIAHRMDFNIRVINLSVAAGVYESYLKDPLTLAAKRAVDAGIVVVAAAGNNGLAANGQVEYGGIASPGNAPWVVTVGASNSMGTVDRGDDIVAGFSSRGPSAIDDNAKPDLVAPGVAIEAATASEPNMSLTGTSMAAPVVAGAIALMLEANPDLTPNAVKAILQYTSETRKGFDHFTQGAGFLNARGAVELARSFADPAWSVDFSTDPVTWNRHIIWGNRRVGGRQLGPRANAWILGVTWGDRRTPAGELVEWGMICGAGCNTGNEEGVRR